jgi:Ca-activated chloride channel family protein
MDIDAAKDYYAILGVSPFANAEEIKHAYRKLARRYHPDSREVGTPTALFREVQAAYAVLGSPKHRKAYDQQRAESGKGPETALAWRILLSQERLSSFYKEQVLYLLLEIQAKKTMQNKRLPLNLCLVIDRSTSMQGRRLKYVKEAVHQIIKELHDDDILGLVTFSDRAKVVLPSQSDINYPRISAKIAAIRASGGTEILQGMQTGLAEIKKHHSEEVISHMIFLTDGRTYGDDEECIAEARRAGARHINITAMGIGEDWNDALLDKIASQSGGTSAYISSPSQVQNLLEEKVRGLKTVLAKGVRLDIRSVNGVQVDNVFLTTPYLERLSAPTNGSIELGTLEIDTPTNILLELIVGQRPTGDQRLLQLELMGTIPALEREERLKHDISCTFVADKPPDEQPPQALLSTLSRITLYRMQEQAWTALEDGNTTEATQRLEIIATRLFDMGEKKLAKAALLEAGRIAGGATPSDKGRKRIKYGTRSLNIPTWR